MNNVNPKSLSAAITKSKSLQEELEMKKATTVLGLIKDDTTTGEKYVIPKSLGKTRIWLEKVSILCILISKDAD